MKKAVFGRRKTDGAGILSVLVGSSMLLMLAFTVAGTSFHHVSMSNRLHHAQSAENMAEAAMAKAIQRLMVDHNLYKAPTAGDTIKLPLGAPDHQCGFLTFHPSTAAAFQSKLKTTTITESVNNFGETSPRPFAGRTLPPESVYLRAVGVDHGVERSVEAVLHIPLFPWTVASEGPIKARDAYIASVKDKADVDDKSLHKPGHLLSSTRVGDATTAITFADNVTVTGDVQASLGADFGNATIKGERRVNAGQVEVPLIDVASYSTEAQAAGANIFTAASPPTSATPIQGPAYSATNLYSNGVKLDGGILYVKGDLTINGPLEGEGALIATGNITVNGGGSLSSTNKVAILSGSNVSLVGSMGRLDLNGVIYAEGELKANNARVTGSVLAAERKPHQRANLADQSLPRRPASMDLANTELFSASEVFSASIKSGSSGSGTVSTFARPLVPVEAGYDVTSGAPPAFWRPSIPPTMTPVDLDIKLQVKPSIPPSRFLDPGTGKYVMRSYARKIKDSNGTLVSAPGVYATEVKADNSFSYQVAVSGPPGSEITPADMDIYINGTHYDYSDPAAATAAKSYALAQFQAQHGRPPSAFESLSLQALIDNRIGGVAAVGDPATETTDQRKMVFVQDAAQAASANLYLEWRNASAGTVTTTSFKVDPSEFIDRAQRIKVLYWRAVP